MPFQSTFMPAAEQTVFYQSDPEAGLGENFSNFRLLFHSLTSPGELTQMKSLSGKRFAYELRVTTARSGRLLWMKTSAFTFTYMRSKQTADEVHLAAVLKGKATAFCQGESAVLPEDGFLLTDHARPTAYTLGSGTEMVFLFVKSDYFHTHAGFASLSPSGLLFPGATPLQRFFTRTLKDICRRAGTIPARDVSDVFDGIFAIIRPVLWEHLSEKGAETRSTADAHRALALDFMQMHLSEHSLCPGNIAAAIGVSERYLSLLFQKVGTSAMPELWSLRLKRSAVQLREQHLLGFSIAKIAESNGFSSAAHFSRRFKEAYGVTPAAWRNGERYSEKGINPNASAINITAAAVNAEAIPVSFAHL